jgi:ornithine carbamoyltransferase
MLKGKNFLCLLDFHRKDIEMLLETSFMMKRWVYSNSVQRTLEGKVVALIFEKPSTRTRVSSEAAIHKLGGYPLILDKNSLQLSRGEPLEDTGKVLGRMVNGIGARVLEHQTLETLSKSSGLPVINLLSNFSHPLQGLTDMMTIKERFGERKVKISFVGDGRDNVLLSLASISCSLGYDLNIASPQSMRPDPEVMKRLEERCEENDTIIDFFNDPYEAVRGTSVVYTDVWISMGEEAIAESKKKELSQFRVTTDLMRYSTEDSIFMHCLPANRGEEVDPEVIDGKKSSVWDQAENRLYTAMGTFSIFI